VPATIGVLLAASVRSRLLIGWLAAIFASAAGLGGAWAWDLPTGAAVVTAFGVTIGAVALARAARRARLREALMTLGILVAVAGALLVAFPAMDQPWLDAAEHVAPPLQTVFLTSAESEARTDALESIERAETELAQLKKLQDDVRWGARKMDEEKQERMRQYIAGRSEILAGDQLSLRELRAVARERQRFALGLPLVLLGLGLALVGRRAGHLGMSRPVRGSM
jgi:hypothetical protein